MMRVVVGVAVFSALVGVAACSSPPSEPEPADLDASVVTADTDIAMLRRLAGQGDPEAQYVLGDRYQYGKGVVPDSSQAVAWYQRAADQGLADGQASLAIMYELGLGVTQDYARAAVLNRTAADQGHPLAQLHLSWAYAGGRGVPQDDAQAVAWLQKAADQGFARAQLDLGSSYRDGQGVEQDYVEAYKWLDLAALRTAADLQGAYAGDRDALAAVMTPEQVAAAQSRAADWQAAFEKRQPD
jgi:TPR repeat protein